MIPNTRHTVRIGKYTPLRVIYSRLDNGGGIPELERFQRHSHEYKIVVYVGLNCDDIMFEGKDETSKRLNLLYDDIKQHYHVIGNLTAVMAKRYVCKACCKGVLAI